MESIQHMFYLALPVFEKMLRPIIVYIFLVVGLRIAGKRELAQLNPFDLVVLLTLSNTVQNAIIGDDNSITGGIIGATTLLAINWLVVRLVHRNRKINDLVEGKVDILIQNGKLNRIAMKREEISEDELTAAAHKEGFHSLAEIQEATLEPNGSLLFTAKELVVVETRQKEMLERMEHLSHEIGLLRGEIARLNHK